MGRSVKFHTSFSEATADLNPALGRVAGNKRHATIGVTQQKMPLGNIFIAAIIAIIIMGHGFCNRILLNSGLYSRNDS